MKTILPTVRAAGSEIPKITGKGFFPGNEHRTMTKLRLGPQWVSKNIEK